MFISKTAYLYPIKSKKYKISKLVLKKYFKKTNRSIFGVIKNPLFYLKKCNNFLKTTMLKYIIPFLI